MQDSRPRRMLRNPRPHDAEQVDIDGPSPGLREFAETDWLPLMQTRLRASTFDSYRRVLVLHAYPYLGDVSVREISTAALNGLYAQLLVEGRRMGQKRGLHPRSVRYVHVILHGLFSHAVDIGLIPSNPASRTRPPRAFDPPGPPRRSWTAIELRQFLDHIADEWSYPAYHLAAMTGMRRGEVVGLHWAEVDLSHRRVLIRRTRVSVGYLVTESVPKAMSQRAVSLDAQTAAVLKEVLGQRPSGDDPDACVFLSSEGDPLHPDLFTQRFDRLVARSGLPRIRLHDLRHTHASLALAAGVPLWVVSERLGHSNPAYTLKQYAHVLPGMQEDAAQTVADLVNSSAG